MPHNKPVTLRLLNQQLIEPQFSKPEDVVSHMGAVQAQEYRLMRWAVAMRTRKPSFDTFCKSFNNGLIIRQHLMRGTWQLVAAEDYGWMMDLFADKARTVIRGWMRANGIDIDEQEHNRIQEILADCTSKGRSVTKEDYEQALLEHDIRMDDHRLSYHIRFSELDGLICSGDLLPMKASYSLAERKIWGGEQPSERILRPGEMDRDEELMLIARKFFQSRQPATLEDFIWWTGLSRRDCLKGISLLGDWIHTEMIDSREFYLTADCRKQSRHAESALLIPPYDEYLIGYKSREVSLPAEFAHKAHNNSGNFNPIVASDGIICGNWKPFATECEAEFFLPGPSADLLAAEWQRYRSAASH